MRNPLAIVLVFCCHFPAVADDCEYTMLYFRPVGSEHRLEAEITLEDAKKGISITSVTHRSGTKLSLVANFDADHTLQSAAVKTDSGNQTQTATAQVEIAGKVKVTRDNGLVDILDCPPGIIVTSAPDWTDAFMLMRRFDERRGGEQAFDGLWIHPTRQPLRLTFKVRHQGSDTVEMKGKSRRLDRFAIELRNGSRYLAWRNDHHQLVRLVTEENERAALILKDWEDATKLLPER